MKSLRYLVFLTPEDEQLLNVPNPPEGVTVDGDCWRFRDEAGEFQIGHGVRVSSESDYELKPGPVFVYCLTEPDHLAKADLVQEEYRLHGRLTLA